MAMKSKVQILVKNKIYIDTKADLWSNNLLPPYRVSETRCTQMSLKKKDRRGKEYIHDHDAIHISPLTNILPKYTFISELF